MANETKNEQSTPRILSNEEDLPENTRMLEENMHTMDEEDKNRVQATLQQREALPKQVQLIEEMQQKLAMLVEDLPKVRQRRDEAEQSGNQVKAAFARECHRLHLQEVEELEASRAKLEAEIVEYLKMAQG